MADERERAERPATEPAHGERLQTRGREENAAQPLSAAKDQGGPERYPAVSQTDGVEPPGGVEQVPGEPRSFDPAADAPTPRRAAGAGAAPNADSWLGPKGDPAEGRR